MGVNSQTILFGGINVLFKTEEPFLWLICASEHQLFKNNNVPEITINVKTGKPQTFSAKNRTFKTKNCIFYQEKDYFAMRILSPGRPSHRSRLSLILSLDNSTIDLFFEDILIPKSDQISLIVPPFSLDELMAIQLLGSKRGVMFHSCGIKTIQNNGLLFTGISGSGKSSTARLWQELGRGVLLGDERVAVRKRGKQFWLISTAWHGKGQLIGPGEIPLDHLFVLHHALVNQATRLKPSDAVSELMTRSFLPFWDRAGMEFTLEFLDDLCSTVPCYDLGFTPDKSAVDFVECLISS
jgi:hypothetical protein